MKAELLNKLKSFGSPVMMGLLAQAAPSMLRGIILEYLQEIKVGELQILVEENKTLWDKVDPEYQAKIKNICSKIKDLNWLTAEWLVSSSRDRISKLNNNIPEQRAEKTRICALISYFLNSPKAYSWLVQQTAIIRQELTS